MKMLDWLNAAPINDSINRNIPIALFCKALYNVVFGHNVKIAQFILTEYRPIFFVDKTA